MMSAHSFPAISRVRSGSPWASRLRLTVSGWNTSIRTPNRSDRSATHASNAPSSRWNL